MFKNHLQKMITVCQKQWMWHLNVVTSGSNNVVRLDFIVIIIIILFHSYY